MSKKKARKRAKTETEKKPKAGTKKRGTPAEAIVATKRTSDPTTFYSPVSWQTLASLFHDLDRRSDSDLCCYADPLHKLELRAAKLFFAALEGGVRFAGWEQDQYLCNTLPRIREYEVGCGRKFPRSWECKSLYIGDPPPPPSSAHVFAHIWWRLNVLGHLVEHYTTHFQFDVEKVVLSKERLGRVSTVEEVRELAKVEAEACELLASLLTSTQLSEEQPPDGDAMAPLSRALGCLAAHPDWTDTKIAKRVGVSRTSLYRMRQYVQARAIMKQYGRAEIRRRQNNRAGKSCDTYRDTWSNTVEGERM